MTRCKLLLIALLAIPVFSYAQKIELTKSGPLIESAAKLYDSAHYKQAIKLLSKVTRSDTNYVHVLYERAISFEADSQYTAAVAACKEALALKEQREFEPDIYNTYGNTLMDMKQYDQAIKIFDEAMAKYPAYSLLPFNKGVAYAATKNYKEAEVWFKKVLLINPYMYSAHYQLGLAALNQGKLVPAYLSFMGYLLMLPEGKYQSSSIKYLSQISGSADAILEFKNARKEQPRSNFQEIEDIIASKAALDKGYKPMMSFDDPLSRQMQAVIEKLEFRADDADFWVQYYVPYFKKMFTEGKFEAMVFHMFSGVNIPVIQSYNKKNKKALEGFTTEAAEFFNKIRATRELFYARRDTVKKLYLFNEGKLVGYGATANNGKILTGIWKGCYATGNKRNEGLYDATGERTGNWVWYFNDGTLKAKENYVNGKLDGVQDYYYENGNLSSHELFTAGQLNGQSIGYYYGGNLKAIYSYKAGKKDGIEKVYYANGNLSGTYTYVNDQLTGAVRTYHKSGKVKEDEQYVNGKNEGAYKRYDDKGTLTTEGQYVKGKADGLFKYYHPNGKLRKSLMFSGEKENGLHQEYFEDGQLSETYTAKNDKIVGEVVSYYKNGKVLYRGNYTDGVLSSIIYYDKAGKEASKSQKKGDLLDVVSYGLNGKKYSHVLYDAKGNLTQTDTVFFASGRVQQVNTFKDDKLNGPSVTYHLNGKKKHEETMVDGENTGYYTSYHDNGKIASEGWMEDDEVEGEWRYYNERGILTTRSNFVGGELDGYKEEYYPDGKKATEWKYHRGWLEKMTQFDDKGNVISNDEFPKGSGKYVLRFPNGKVFAEGTYKNGDFDGVYKSFYFDGSLAKVYRYKRGELDSTSITYHYGGKKASEGQYKYGNKVGIWKIYDEDGKLQRTVAYADNEQNGPEEFFYADGKKDFISNYKSDLLQGGVQKYDPKGDLAYQTIYDEGNIQSYTYLDKDGKLVPEIALDLNKGIMKTFFQNGKPSRECSFADGAKNGEDKIYYANGQLRSVDQIVFNNYHGVSKNYYEDGKLKSEYNYVNDNAEGVCREYHGNGSLKKEITYQDGIFNGPTKFYNENGKLMRTMMYYYGNLMAVTNEKI